MFNSISWEIFLTTIVVIVGGYYGISTLILYRRELVAWIRSCSKQSIMPAIAEAHSAGTSSMMGSVNEESENLVHRFSTVDTAELTVGEDDVPDEPIRVHNLTDPLIGVMYDLLSEARMLIRLIGGQKSGLQECEELFRSLLLRYPQLRKTDHQGGVSLYIVQAFDSELHFSLTMDQVNGWWEEPAN